MSKVEKLVTKPMVHAQVNDDVAWCVDSGVTIHECKDRYRFKTYESLNDGSILHMESESTALVHGRGCVNLRSSSGKTVSLLNVLHVPNIRNNMISSSVLNNYGYKHVIDSNKFVLSKHGAISWAFNKQTCITRSTMEYEFLALAAVDYSQMYNGKSRHLGARYNMVSIEFVRYQQNLADHLTKGLARDLVLKLAKGMGLQFNIETGAHVFTYHPKDVLGYAERYSNGLKGSILRTPDS
ncbi:hypothetical protein Tco_0452096 [Tanacetum coccineum]